MLTIAYIGNGKSTNRYHLPFVLLRENIKVKTIYNPRIHHDQWAKIPGIAYTESIEDIWEDPEIDLAVICTPKELHYSYAKTALLKGKHVLVEKPFMPSYKEAFEIFTLAKEKGLIAQCYQNRRFDSDYLTAKQVIESGKLGKLYEVEMNYDYYRPEIPRAAACFSPLESFLYGHGSHTADQVISYFGVPKNVTCDVRCLLGENAMSDYFDLDFFYDNPLKVSVRSSYFRIKKRPSFVLYGTKGMFLKESPDRQEEHLKLFYLPPGKDFGVDLPEHYGTLTYLDENGVWREEKVPTVQGDYGKVYDALYETAVHKAPPLITPEQTLLAVKIMEEGSLSAREAGVVCIGE